MKKSTQDILASSDVQTFLEHSILKPLLDKVFQYMYPYLLGVMSLWIIMFLCTIMVLVILLSGIPKLGIQNVHECLPV